MPAGLLVDILELRAYAQAKSMHDAATTKEARARLPGTPVFQLVQDIEFELVREARDADAAAAHG